MIKAISHWESLTGYRCPCCKAYFSNQNACTTHIASCLDNPSSASNNLSSYTSKYFKIGNTYYVTSSTPTAPSSYGRTHLDTTIYSFTVVNSKAVSLSISTPSLLKEELSHIAGTQNHNEITSAKFTTQVNALLANLSLSIAQKS